MTVTRLLVFLSIFLIAVFGLGGCDSPKAASQTVFIDDIDLITQFYDEGRSNVFVSSKGIVQKILSDDLAVPRHQKFILRLSNGQTLLVNHNIDLAPRIDDLKVGDEVKFRGEYLWNSKGGAIHYTHRDPSGKKFGGWIDHNGRRYE